MVNAAAAIICHACSMHALAEYAYTNIEWCRCCWWWRKSSRRTRSYGPPQYVIPQFLFFLHSFLIGLVAVDAAASSSLQVSCDRQLGWDFSGILMVSFFSSSLCLHTEIAVNDWNCASKMFLIVQIECYSHHRSILAPLLNRKMSVFHMKTNILKCT